LKVSGSKNAALPILMASLLCRGSCRFSFVPQLRDTDTLLKILKVLGSEVLREKGNWQVKTQDEGPLLAPYELVSTQRASFYALGALLGRRRRAEVSLPGGCVIGLRPVDLHLKGFRALGVDLKIEGGYVKADARKARGGRIFLGGPYGSSVGATANLLLLAATLEGETFIDQAACEPEIVALCNFLSRAGATIGGAGSPHLKIKGRRHLEGIDFAMPFDRIEAATFLILACLKIGEGLFLEGVQMEEQGALLDVLGTLGFFPEEQDGKLCMRRLLPGAPVTCTTLPYPGLPSDCQAQLMVLLSQEAHMSVITERIYPDRFMHSAELNRMGGRIRKEGASAFIAGGQRLSGAPVMASDLRASAALVLAGLVAEGKSLISRVYHIDRGYEKLDEKLRAVGANIIRKNLKNQ
jgi:UDP-N-acetylglucosamine 1-carboxyvinyltransferase